MTAGVLIVDDSSTVRMDLMELLTEGGLRAVGCATLAEARQALASEAFALAILDVGLPDGDGLELLQDIRAMPSARTMAIMLLSSEAEIRDRVRGLTRGADEYLGKPYDRGYLVARARELAHRHASGSSLGNGTILIVDDSVTYREELKAALESVSYRVVVTGSGEEGLRVAADVRPSAIVVDAVLPGIDGATMIRRIRLDAALRGVPCFLLTGSEDRSAEIHALDAGADAFALKEDSTAVILARIAAMLRGAEDRSGRRGATSLQGPKKLLVVDDSEIYRQHLAEALRSQSCKVILARCGEEALELLAVQPVDCVLLDLLMPGIGGRETCERIKGAPAMRDIPVIILTAVEDREAMIQGLAAGADDYIAKSSDFDLIRARVLAQIRRKQFEDEFRNVREQILRAKYEASQARTALEAAEARAALARELELKNEELESFSYSVAHDLRAPLRSIDGFSLALLEDCGDGLSAEGQQYLRYVREAAQHMARLIDDLLALSRVSRGELDRGETDLSLIVRSIAGRLATSSPIRRVDMIVADGLMAHCDDRLMSLALENLISNAWKFTGKRDAARIEFGTTTGTPRTYFVRDNGAGFDMSYASNLFGVFQRLHSAAEFEGTGIGLATVQRIIRRHGGRIWAEAALGEGATFYFALESGQHGTLSACAPGSSAGSRNHEQVTAERASPGGRR